MIGGAKATVAQLPLEGVALGQAQESLLQH